ncbi:MAG: molybdopterin-dependent oxidoreductase [Pseudomonadota bacterium]
MTIPPARRVQTMCPMNCHPTLCGMNVMVEGDRLIGIEGDETNPDSKGFLCMRGNAAHEIIDNPRRVLKPLIRVSRDSDDWREATWGEAMDLIRRKMRAAGRERVALWAGHGLAANDYGVGVKSQLIERFANLYGCQWWNPAMICWGLGGFGFGLTGALETSTKEDMGAHSNLIILWGANLASQPNTSRHLMAAKRRGAEILTIDVRRTEAAALADESYLLLPGSDAALALALMHVIIAEGLGDDAYIRDHTVGFEALKSHVAQYTPDWAAHETGLTAEQIVGLARRYAAAAPAMIVAGGSSLHKGDNSWRAARAIACMPALTGSFGRPGGGLGPRHGAHSHGRALASINAAERRKPGAYIPAQMEAIQTGLEDGRLKVLIAIGSNILSSFPDEARTERGLKAADLVVSYDLFMNETARRCADIVLPATAWLEEVGCKATNTHIHLSDRALPAAGDARPIGEVMRDLAKRLGVDDYFPWASQEDAIDAVLDHPATGRATVAGMRANGGRAALNISEVAYPTHEYATPSGKIEFVSARAEAMGLPALPEPGEAPDDARGDASAPDYPLRLAHGRTWTHFHSFYDQGRALPTLAARNAGPELWMAPGDAAPRGVSDGAAIRIHNERGAFEAAARVTDQMPQGAVWIRDGWAGLNALCSSKASLPDSALDVFPFTVGQSSYETRVEVEPMPAA